MRFSTKAIRVGQCPDGDYGAVIQPIYQSATFTWKDLDHIPPHDYTRVSNPNRSSLEAVIAELEGATHCTLFSSGMAAIVAAFSLLEVGDHLLVADSIYGGTHRVANELLPRQGVEASTFDPTDPATLVSVVKPNTKMLIFETPTNPNLTLADIEAIATEAKKLGVLTVVDNTFASPFLQNPIALGIDIVVHSTTKYISGHSDVIGGAVVTNLDEVHQRVFEFNKTIGANPSPFDCWLSLRGVKTLALRMERHCSNAQRIAEYLYDHPLVAKVYYPGLPSHPDHALAKKQMRGFGGMVSFEIAGTETNVRRFAEATNVFLLAESLGGIESLMAYPPLMSHACMTEEERLAMGITPLGLRLSVGIEDVEDLIEDLDNAFKIAFATTETRELVEA